MSVKDDAIKQYQEEAIERAKTEFQNKVNGHLASIHSLSQQLATAKKSFRELEYVDPTFTGFDD